MIGESGTAPKDATCGVAAQRPGTPYAQRGSQCRSIMVRQRPASRQQQIYNVRTRSSWYAAIASMRAASRIAQICPRGQVNMDAQIYASNNARSMAQEAFHVISPGG